MNTFSPLMARLSSDQPAQANEFIEPDEPGRTSRFYSAASLAGKPVPPREWLVEGVIPGRNVTLFAGDGGTGKSLMALHLAVSAVVGADWIGKPVKKGRALYLSAEDDDDELHRRIDDILRHEGRNYSDLAGLTLRSLAGEDALLATEPNRAVSTQLTLLKSALFNELEERAASELPGLIVIDTLADVYPANENDRAKVRQFIGMLRGLAIRQRCAVVLLGHPSLSGLNSGTGTSGSTAWSNSVRSRLYLRRIAEDDYEPDPNKRVLTVMKANYGQTGEEVGLIWRDGVLVPELTETSFDRMTAAAKAERVFLKLLDERTRQNRFVSASPSSTYAPTVFAKHPGAEGQGKRILATAMENLFARGVIEIAEHGKGAKARRHIARKEVQNDD